MEATLSFRKSVDSDPVNSAWRRKHRDLLARCGIPDKAIESDKSLTYLLLHGDDELGTGWTLKWISRQQAAELLCFLAQELPNTTGYELVSQLRRYLGEDVHDR